VSSKIIIVFSSLLLAGCSWNSLNSKPSVAPVQAALSGFEKPYPGKYLLLVSSTGLDQPVVVGGQVCTSHDFSVEAARSFEESVQKTLANVVEEIEVVSAPVTRKQIKTAKARALITITGEDLSASLLVNSGFFTKESQARVKVSARVQVLKSKGGVFDEQLISDDTASVTIGKCLDAYKTVTAASAKVLGQLVTQIGNSVSQSLSSKK
jgi:hypothetical protein